jgi:hypothetical protein
MSLMSLMRNQTMMNLKILRRSRTNHPNKNLSIESRRCMCFPKKNFWMECLICQRCSVTGRNRYQSL